MAAPSPEYGHRLLFRREYDAALAEFEAVLRVDPTNWQALAGAGQSAHYLGRLPEAIQFLQKATSSNPREATLFAIYGTVLEQAGNLAEAKKSMGRALEVDPDFAEGFNLLADWQRKVGELEKALHNYDAGVKALARRLVRRMSNHPANPIIKHDDNRGEVWVECAMFGALWLSSDANVDSLAWPTGHSAEEEERTEAHRGLYFFDERQGRRTIRVFLPNYFASFRIWLLNEPIFEFLVGNQGTIHKQLGDADLAEKRFAEADLFSARRRSPPPSA